MFAQWHGARTLAGGPAAADAQPTPGARTLRAPCDARLAVGLGGRCTFALCPSRRRMPAAAAVAGRIGCARVSRASPWALAGTACASRAVARVPDMLDAAGVAL